MLSCANIVLGSTKLKLWRHVVVRVDMCFEQGASPSSWQSPKTSTRIARPDLPTSEQRPASSRALHTRTGDPWVPHGSRSCRTESQGGATAQSSVR